MLGINLYPKSVHPSSLDQLYAMGERGVRYWLNGTQVIKGPGVYDFQQTITDLTTIRNAGMYAYVNWGYVPAFMSDGKLAYGPLSCWVPRKPDDPEPNLDPAQGPGGWRYARPSEMPWCHPPNIPNIDDHEVTAFTYALAGECSDLIDFFGTGNEWDLRDFWPPIADPRYKDEGYTRAVRQMIEPAVRGYRSGCTGGAAVFVGPENATAGGLRMLLELERELGLRLFDVLSGHLYSWDGTWPGDSFDRTADFLKVVDELGDGRPFWDTECDNPEPGAYVSWLAEQHRRFGDRIRAHFRHKPWLYFEEGEQAFNRGERLTPNADYEAMRRLTAEWAAGGGGSKRRSVR